MSFYLSKLSVGVFNTCRSIPKMQFRSLTFDTYRKPVVSQQVRYLNQEIQKSAAIDQRKIPKRKARQLEKKDETDLFSIIALSTARQYDLQGLDEGLKAQKLYDVKLIDNNAEVLHAVAKYKVEDVPREIFFFREGSTVFWNIQSIESSNILKFLKQYETDSYAEGLVVNETEFMKYSLQNASQTSALDLDKNFNVTIKSKDNLLEKYTFSNAIALSVKLGIWEAYLDQYIKSIRHLADDLSLGKKLSVNQKMVLQKHGELLRLKMMINLESDLLNMPDFYWDREQFEPLYLKMANYFSLDERTQAINYKLNICNELVEVLSKNLTEKYSTKLEWLIIILIMIEVVFESIHYIERHGEEVQESHGLPRSTPLPS